MYELGLVHMHIHRHKRGEIKGKALVGTNYCLTFCMHFRWRAPSSNREAGGWAEIGNGIQALVVRIHTYVFK